MGRTRQQRDIEILSTCLREPMMITHLICKVNINYSPIMKRLDNLIDRGLIEEVPPTHIRDKKVKMLYSTTQFGIRYLKDLTSTRYIGNISL